FRVISPDGTCVIGKGCLVEQSTLGHRGAIDSILLDGQIFRVRYSGADSPLERFSITSLDGVAGDWKVEMLPEDGIIPYAEAMIEAEENNDYWFKKEKQCETVCSYLPFCLQNKEEIPPDNE
ncbi:hypothetical protein LCGC14_0729130, partial [marine sediment metagenome]